MESKKLLVFLVATFVLAFAIANVSATATINSVEINGVQANGNSVNVAVFAGQTITVKVVFYANDDANDTTVRAEVQGGNSYSVSTEKFDAVAGSTYSEYLNVQVPSNIDPSQDVDLYVTVDSKNGHQADTRITLPAQRSSYVVEILDANMPSSIEAGMTLPLDIVLKNRGRQDATDTFVSVKIDALGVSERAYFGDLSPTDRASPDTFDSAERRLLVSIPSTAQPGIYPVEIDAYNGDTTTTVTKRVTIVGASADTMVVPSSDSKTVAVGDQASFSITLVNSGNTIKVYNLAVENTDTNLNVNLDDSVIAVPAGSSRTTKVTAQASKAGNYNFAVNVESGNSLVQKQNFAVEASGSAVGGAFAGSTAVVLTVILAIVFVVLLVVLIVLLTRKPEKTQEFGESYY